MHDAQNRREGCPFSALVLDFGGVVSRTMFETHETTEAALGLPRGTLAWKGPFDPDGDPLWRAMQGGELGERDYWRTRAREVGALVGRNWNEVSDFVKAARGSDPERVIRPEALRVVRAVRAAGIGLAILSNELDLFYGEELRRRLPLLDSFDAVIDGTYTGILKPNPQAYGMCAEALGVEPAECLFVDDQLRNVEGALMTGMGAIHFDVLAPAATYTSVLGMLGLEYESTEKGNGND